jgi:hypothetical protein
MAKMKHIYSTTLDILDWIESQNLDCLYRGIRSDCALALGVALTNPTFHFAWNCIRFTLDGNGRVVAYLP